jgi:8-oxo-dGTP diphosphatase
MTSKLPLQVAVGVIKNSKGEILISRRNNGAHQGGLWEFPGGKVEAGESVEQALARELKEELDLIVGKISPLITIHHCYTDLTVQLHVWQVDAYSGEIRGCEGQPLQWATVNELISLDFPKANLPIISAVRLPAHYAILDANDVDGLLKNLNILLAKDIKLIQIRAKALPLSAVEDFLVVACSLASKAGTKLLLNSAMQGAWHGHGDGVHLTSRHLMALHSRPANLNWLAASCHNLKELQHAQAIGVDFAVLAPVLSTLTHPGANTLGWELFAEMVGKINIPVFALGGLSLDDAHKARYSGGQGMAGIRAFIFSGNKISH